MNSNQQSGYVALGILVISVLVLPSFWYFSSLGRRSDSDIPSELGSEIDGDEYIRPPAPLQRTPPHPSSFRGESKL